MAPCCAVPPPPIHQNLALHGCLLRVVAKPLFPSAQSSCSGSLYLSHAGFGPCIVSEPAWGCPGLESSQTRHLPEMWQHQTVRGFPRAVPEKLCLVGRACHQTSCLSAAHCRGCRPNGVCRYLSCSPRQEPLWSGAGRRWRCLCTARFMAPLWGGFWPRGCWRGFISQASASGVVRVGTVPAPAGGCGFMPGAAGGGG